MATRNILERTAEAIYRADRAPAPVKWDELVKADRRRYENMAAAALSIALRLEIDEELEISQQLTAKLPS